MGYSPWGSKELNMTEPLTQMYAAKSLQSCPTLCNPRDGSPPGSLCPWDSPGKNTGVGSHSLRQGIFPVQELNLGLLNCKQILYHLSHQGSPSKGKGKALIYLFVVVVCFQKRSSFSLAEKPVVGTLSLATNSVFTSTGEAIQHATV